MYLCNLDYIKEKGEHLSFIFEMDRPRYKCMVIQRGPSVGCKMEATRMFLIRQLAM